MTTHERKLERQMLGAFATVARQWGATPVNGTIAEQLGLGVEDSEIRIIYLLGARTEDVRPGEIADHLGVTRSALSKSLTRLRLANLVESVPADDDRRSVFVTLTAAGGEAYRRLLEFGMSIVHTAKDGLSEEETEAVTEFLSRFAEGLGGPPPVVLPPKPR